MQDINKIPIFVSSSDAYADIWPAFFSLLKREWPEYNGTIYLNTEHLEYSHDGLNIVCTKLGRQRYFGDTFLRGIDKIREERFLLIMIDYFFEGRVNVPKLQEIYEIFLEDDIDTFTLMTQPYGFAPIHNHPQYSRIVNEEGWRIMFSFQTAFWKKSSFERLVRRWDDPWHAEHFGSKRAALEGMTFYILSSREDMPIRYDESGVLHGGGRWLMPAISRIDLTNIPLDLSATKRKIHEPSTQPNIDFLKGEAKYLHRKILSWLDIICRHPRAIKMLYLDVFQRFRRLYEILRGEMVRR